MRGASAISAALAAALTALACGEPEQAPTTPAPPPTPPVPDAEAVVIDVAGHGEITIELYSDKAPATVANFKKLAREGFYDGTTFHRVTPRFMIQGGDPNSRDRDPRNDGRGGPGYTIPDELNDVRHLRGVVSMANRGRPKTAGSQFFILVQDTTRLDGKYTAFGRVISGMDVVDAIANVERDRYGRWGPRNRPLEDVVMRSVRVEPHPTGPASAGAEAQQGEPGRARPETAPAQSER